LADTRVKNRRRCMNQRQVEKKGQDLPHSKKKALRGRKSTRASLLKGHRKKGTKNDLRPGGQDVQKWWLKGGGKQWTRGGTGSGRGSKWSEKKKHIGVGDF